MDKITIKNITFGQGIPKICVSLCATTADNIVQQASNFIKHGGFNLIEWRLDYFKDIDHLPSLVETASRLKEITENTPLLATFRTQKEGGEKKITLDHYITINQTLIQKKLVDLLDIELLLGDDVVKEFIHSSHQHNIYLIVSNHNFEYTPSKQQIIDRLCKMQDLGADIVKIAVMPQQLDDVFTLLSASHEMFKKYAKKPMIAISMGKMGLISRLVGESSGSAITFGLINNASAPGQIHVDELKTILDILHGKLS